MFRHERDKLDLDSDYDGLSDYEEINIYETDPYNPDTDRDGVSDGEEVARGLNPRGAGYLKDLFFSHAGNNYQPGFLQPKRIAGYSLSIIAIKLLVIVFVVVLPITAWLTPDVAREQAIKIISLTNNIRTGLGLAPLVESNALDESAYQKAQDMLVNQYFAHLSPDKKGLKYWLSNSNYNYAAAGENLAMGFSSAEEVVEAWVQSPTHYNNIIDDEYSEIGVGVVSGDFEGTDTTLVAQYFGAPKISQPVAEAVEPPVVEIITPKPTPKPTPLPVFKPTPVVTEPIPEPAVLSETEEPVVKSEEPMVELLKAPVLITPKDGALVSDKKVSLTVYAPKAEKVIVYVDHMPIFTAGESTLGYFETDIYLTEGRHYLQFKALKDKKYAWSQKSQLSVDTTAPLYNPELSQLKVIEDGEQKVVRAKVYLGEDTKSAEVSFGHYQINLSPEKNSYWTGSTIIFQKDDLFNPVVLASVKATDKAGNELLADVNWAKAKPSKPSVTQQYIFARENINDNTRLIFGISAIYYQILLGLAVVVLLFNIFIKIKQQNFRIIFSGLGFIGLLVILIVF